MKTYWKWTPLAVAAVMTAQAQETTAADGGGGVKVIKVSTQGCFQQEVSPAEAAGKVLAQLANDGLLLKASGFVRSDAVNRVEIAARLNRVKEGQETFRDFAWLPTICRLYREEDKNTPAAIIKLLVAAGADVNARDKEGSTALFLTGGSAEECRALLDCGADVNARNAAAEVPLHRYLGMGGEGAFDTLLAAGADINAVDKDGDTPLHNAFCCSSDASRSKLIAAGANVNVKNAKGDTPLDIAIRSNMFEVALELLHAGAEVNREKYSPLFLACFFGQEDECRKLIESGVAVDEPLKDKQTVLMLSASVGNEDMCRLLLELGANVNAVDEEKNTPLHLAAEHDHAAVCKLLVEAGADIEARSKWGKRTPLALAVSRDAPAAVDALLTAGAKVNVRCDCEPLFFNALGFGKYKDNSAMLRKLLNAGANVHAREKYTKRTALHKAAIAGNMYAVDVLLEAGADINAKDCNGMTPFHDSIRKGNVDMCRKLMAAGADSNMSSREAGLLIARLVSREHVGLDADSEQISKNHRIVDFLLELKPDIGEDSSVSYALFSEALRLGNAAVLRKLVAAGVQPLPGISPLCLATMTGDVDALKKLLAEGADANDSFRGLSALAYAAYMGSDEVCRVLLAAGADANAPGVGKWCPLKMALYRNNVNTVSLLMAAGARVQSDMMNMCIDSGDAELVKAAVAAGADVNDDKNYLKHRPLHRAVQKNNALEISRVLLEAGADVNAVDISKNTPLHLAVKSDTARTLDSPLCALLIAAGADVSLKDDDDKTPADIVNKEPRNCSRIYISPEPSPLGSSPRP